jgi:hypothetical protein
VQAVAAKLAASEEDRERLRVELSEMRISLKRAIEERDAAAEATLDAEIALATVQDGGAGVGEAGHTSSDEQMRAELTQAKREARELRSQVPFRSLSPCLYARFSFFSLLLCPLCFDLICGCSLPSCLRRPPLLMI